MKRKWIVPVVAGLWMFFNAALAGAADEGVEKTNRLLLCANFLKQAANNFELSPVDEEYKWHGGTCHRLSWERAEAVYYMLTSCLQTDCGNRQCRIPSQYFEGTSCPYAAELVDIPDFLAAFAKELDQHDGEEDGMESEGTSVPLCITSPEDLRRAAAGCANAST